MSKVKDQERIEAIRELRKMLRPGARVYTVLRHVSSSGVSRRIDVYTILPETHHGRRTHRMRYLSGYVGKAVGYRRHPDGGLVVSGCGMDMGFEIVYNLGRTLFPKGFIPAKFNGYGRNGAPATDRDTDGGYALQHEWL